MPDIITKNETTNAVLKEKIEGLAELTAERFTSIKEALIRIEINSQAYASKKDLEEIKVDFNNTIKRIEDAFLKHAGEDQISFGSITAGQKEVRDIMLKWIGGLTIITIALPFVVKFFWG